MPQLISTEASLRRHSPRERGSPLCRGNESNTNGDQEKRKELAARERSDQFGIGFAAVFDHDSKDRVANEKQSGQNAVWLAHARSHKPENCEQGDALEKCFVKLRRVARRQNRA